MCTVFLLYVEMMDKHRYKYDLTVCYNCVYRWI